MTSLRSALARTVALLSLSLTACSSAVVPSADGGDAGVSALPDAPPGALPDAPPGAPPDAPLTCSFDGATTVHIALSGPNGTPLDCSAPRPTPAGAPGVVITRMAAVVAVRDDATGAHVTLDYCSPAADCVQQLGTLTIAAPDFTLAAGGNPLLPGQYVRIQTRTTFSFGCTMQVEIYNAPSWDGDTNRVRGDSALLAAAADGERSALPDAAFAVSRQGIDCVASGPSCGDGQPELFALSFQGSCRNCLRNPDPVLVRQGQTGQFMIDQETLQARNHRSFTTGACDDYWNYAWTVREVWSE
jgi:hypothetical protein